MSLAAKGISHINQVVEHYAKTYPKKDMILLDSSGSFSECLAMSIIIKHLKKMMPSAVLMWGIEQKYYKMWDVYLQIVGSVIFPTPNDSTPNDRIAWRNHAKSLGLADVQFPGLGIVRPNVGFIKNFISNAGITKMLVPTIPVFPHDDSDLKWHDSISSENGVLGKPYIAIEWQDTDRINLIAKKANNVIWIGKKDSKFLKVDARDCSMRQSKIVIQRAKAFIACSEDYKNLSICDGLTTKTFDVESDSPLSLLGQANILCQA